LRHRRIQHSTFTARDLGPAPRNVIAAEDEAVAVEPSVGLVVLPDTDGLKFGKGYELFALFGTAVHVVSHDGAAVGTVPAYGSAYVTWIGEWAFMVR